MRLNSKAKNLLLAEIDKQATPLNLDVQKSIVLKRLDKLTQEQGQPLAKAEIEHLVLDMFPNFDGQVLNKAARVNQPNRLGFGLKIAGFVGAGLVGLAGLVWLVNLPYPMVRRPVARVAPLLLLPSYLSMDRNYREAIAHVEQADQLVNQATSAADITLGAEKVQQAQANLDQLPVWFLGYEPIMICQYMGCSWHFTFDEFSRARAQVGRMDARIFQENNALNQLQSSETAIQQAKNTYEKATTPQQQQAAIAAWQSALNQLKLIPASTLAGSMGQARYQNYEQEFRQVAGWMAGTTQTQTMIAAAEQFGKLATQGMAKAPHTVSEWQGIYTLWQQALERLKQVDPKDPDYLASQTYLAEYTQKQLEVQTSLEKEQTAVKTLETAHQRFQDWLGTIPAPDDSPEQIQRVNQLQDIIDELKKVSPGTTAYPEAQRLIKQAQGKVK
jgi:tetratricopeptide (TPR) repeat protein